MTVTGKVRKVEMREVTVAELGPAEAPRSAPAAPGGGDLTAVTPRFRSARRLRTGRTCPAGAPPRG